MADPGTSLVFSYPFFLRGMADTGTSFDFSCPFSFQSFCKLLLDCCGFIIGLSCLYFTTVNSLTEPLFYNVLCFLTSAVVKSWACTVNKADFPLTYARLCFSSFSSLSSGHPWDMNTLYEVSSWISFYFRPKLPIISTTSFTQNISGNLMEVFFFNKRLLRCLLGDIKFHANTKERVQLHFRSLQFLSYEEKTTILKLMTVRIPWLNFLIVPSWLNFFYCLSQQEFSECIYVCIISCILLTRFRCVPLCCVSCV